MENLAGRRCKPCEGGVQRFDASQARAWLGQVPGWALGEDAASITKTYRFNDFYETMAFVNALAWIAHREDHHPVLTVSYRECAVRYTTHAIAGLSENDFICAAKLDNVIGA
ncbi:MAG: 4a-hydroxytetrahydrobiopterin dehydratase [Gammaproteobacteria bacterium]